MGGVDQNHSNQDIGEKKYKTYFLLSLEMGHLSYMWTLQWVVGGSGRKLLMFIVAQYKHTSHWETECGGSKEHL